MRTELSRNVSKRVTLIEEELLLSAVACSSCRSQQVFISFSSEVASHSPNFTHSTSGWLVFSWPLGSHAALECASLTD